MKKDILQSSYVITSNASVREAMGAITDNQRGAVIVVDNRGHLHGVVSDGDIRRAMLGGATLDAPVEKITNLRPIILTESDVERGRGKEIFEKEASVTLLPVVGPKNVLRDVLVRDPKKRKDL
jgi:CBS domain-containing protein